jgi:hypothetical protein
VFRFPFSVSYLFLWGEGQSNTVNKAKKNSVGQFWQTQKEEQSGKSKALPKKTHKR